MVGVRVEGFRFGFRLGVGVEGVAMAGRCGPF